MSSAGERGVLAASEQTLTNMHVCTLAQADVPVGSRTTCTFHVYTRTHTHTSTPSNMQHAH